MAKTIAVLILATMAACTSGDDGAAGSGNDVLPKRGERTGDPTIVSATASCSPVIALPGSMPGKGTLEIQIDGSDPMGEEKLGQCAVTVGSATEQDSFYDGSCDVSFGSIPCDPGTYIAGITVSNEMGGVTTASVTLRVAN